MVNLAGLFSRKERMPSLASGRSPVQKIHLDSSLWASMGWPAPSIFHRSCRDRATETAEVFRAISVAISRALGISLSGASNSLTNPCASASRASKTLPVRIHSAALLIPTIRGRNHVLHASGIMPRLVKTNPMRASRDARRMSMGRVNVMPKPTAGPFMAAISGFFMS